MPDEKVTHFGYQQINSDEKADKVRGVFDSVASRYDLMNDLMSFGIHRIWKRFAIELAAVRPGQCILDLAGGTGDLAKLFASFMQHQGHVVLADINAKMLTIGRDRLINTNLVNITAIQADAENLPFADNSFDCVSIGFGLRNVTNKGAALLSMFRVLKPGGRLLVLEFSKPTNPLVDKLYNFYSFNILPKLGKMITQDETSYQYLVESIRMHPNQETLKTMLEQSGFTHCDYFNMTGGIVSLHRGFKA